MKWTGHGRAKLWTCAAFAKCLQRLQDQLRFHCVSSKRGKEQTASSGNVLPPGIHRRHRSVSWAAWALTPVITECVKTRGVTLEHTFWRKLMQERKEGPGLQRQQSAVYRADEKIVLMQSAWKDVMRRQAAEPVFECLNESSQISSRLFRAAMVTGDSVCLVGGLTCVWCQQSWWGEPAGVWMLP